MRNRPVARTRNEFAPPLVRAAVVGVLLVLVGCAAKPQTRDVLNGGYAALSQRRLNDAQAAADQILSADATGRGAAEALYLRGRVFEERSHESKDPAGQMQLSNEARQSYARSLALKPAPKLEAAVRTQLANVAYYQEDFVTAAREGSAAYANLEKPLDQAWALYRVGLSQQRLGRFTDADQTFAAVQQKYAGTEPAKRAAARTGARAFHVQVGSFSDAANAQRTIAALRSEGYSPLKSADPTGKQLVAVGPVNTYEQAKGLRIRLAAKYPDAIILP